MRLAASPDAQQAMHDITAIIQHKTGINPTQLFTASGDGLQFEQLIETFEEGLKDDPDFLDAMERLRQGLDISADPTALAMLVEALKSNAKFRSKPMSDEKS